MATQAQRTELLTLLVGMFDAAPTAELLTQLEAGLDAGATVDQYAAVIAQSSTFATVYPTTEDFVANFATNLLGSNVSAEVLAVANGFVAGQIEAGVSVDDVIQSALNALGNIEETNETWGAAAAALNNKVEVATYFVENVTGTGYSTLAEMKQILANVTNDDATVTAAKAEADVLANPGQTFTLTTATNDILVGTNGSDTFTGDATTYQNSDRIVDASTADSDVLNLTIAGNATPDVVNVENINITTTVTNGTNPQITASSLSGVEVLTVTGADVVVGGSTIAGDKDVDVTALDASKVAKVVAGAGTKDVILVQATKAGVELDASTATGNVTVTGAATVTAGAMGAGDTLAFNALGNATEDAKAVSATTGAETVNVAAGFTGAITVDASAAKNVVVNNAAGGATITATGETGTIGTDGIVVKGIDDTGVSVTTSYVGTTTAKGVIDLQGTSATSDVATVSAAGVQTLRTNTGNQVDVLNLSGNGQAATYEVTGAAATYTLTGSQAVTLSGDEASFDGKTVTDSTEDATTLVKITTLDDSDLSKVAVDKISVAATADSKTLTVADGANIELAADQTTAFAVAGKNADATVNLSTGDDTNASGATIDITTGTLTASSNIKTLNLDASVGKFTASTATTLATTAALNVTGSKDVALGKVTAKSVDASALTGKLSLTSETTATITSGAGADTIVLNDTNGTTTQFTVDAGAGNNNITITNAKAATAIATGSGDDTITIAEDNAIVVVTGAGSDTVTINANVDSDAILVAGEGSGDKLVFADTDGNDFSDNTNFNFTGFETLNISALTSGTITVSAAQFNNQTFTLLGNATADLLTIVGGDTAETIDASNITVDTASVAINGGKGADIITGTASNDTISFSFGGDTIDGGAGTDTFTAATGIQGASAGTGSANVAGVVINLGTTAVSEAVIQAGTSMYLGGSATSVASGTANLGYSADATANISEVTTLSNIENVTGSAGADYIVGSSAGNTIDGGAGVDYIVLGAGTDVVVQTYTDVDTTAGAVTDRIVNFASGTDTIKVGTAGSGTTYSEAGASVADLATLLTAADTALDGTVKIYVGQVTGGSAYAVLDDDGTGYTSVIELVGVDLAGVAATDFVV